MELLLEPKPSNCMDPASQLSTFTKIVTEGYQKVCSKECPCSGNPMLYRNDKSVTIIDLENTEDKNKVCIDSKDHRCLYFAY